MHEHGHLYILAETQTQVETIIIDLKHIIMLPFFPQNWSKIAATIFAIANYSENLSCFHYFNVIYHSIVLCSFKNYTSEWENCIAELILDLRIEMNSLVVSFGVYNTKYVWIKIVGFNFGDATPQIKYF